MVGGTTILLFNSKMQLKTGKQKLRLWPGKEADGSLPTSTPGKVPNCQSIKKFIMLKVSPFFFFIDIAGLLIHTLFHPQ